ncbi:hypothetical protein O4H52_03080 [Sphingomonadaceae bacterium G21617-S1]|nr:hypothetical protein [Sphingomonadaceae bacterium G21617-S1]
MIPTSKAPIRYIPEIFDQADTSAPVFLIRPGDPIERAQLEAELAGECRAGLVFDAELQRAFTEGVTVLMSGDDGLEELLALAAAEAGLGDGEKLPATDRQILARARDVLEEHWPEYGLLVAQQKRRRQMLPLFAFRRFVVGWDNIDEALPFAAGLDRLVTLDATGSIPDGLRTLAGFHAYKILRAGTQLKNSAPPSKSGGTQETSISASPSRKGGVSRTRKGRTSGRKIPG